MCGKEGSGKSLHGMEKKCGRVRDRSVDQMKTTRQANSGIEVNFDVGQNWGRVNLPNKNKHQSTVGLANAKHNAFRPWWEDSRNACVDLQHSRDLARSRSNVIDFSLSAADPKPYFQDRSR